MAQLNHVAVEALLIIGQVLFNEPLMRLRSQRFEALKKALEYDVAGESDNAAGCLKRYRSLSDEYEDLFAKHRELTRQNLGTLFRLSACGQ